MTETRHPSIALWSHPRSMSTALERMFIERGDFTVFHEEFAYVYYVHEDRAIPHKHTDPGHPTAYREIRDLMEAARGTRPVFHKDFPYHAVEHLLSDSDYLMGQVNTFLIRDPEQAVLSHATVHPDLTADVLGYRELVALYDRVHQLTGSRPAVIVADDLARDPVGTVAAYCAATGIAFRPEALNWAPGDRPEWATWRGWHTDVAASGGLRRPAANYRFTFEERPRLQRFAEECAPYYEYLSRFRISIDQLNTVRN